MKKVDSIKKLIVNGIMNIGLPKKLSKSYQKI